MTRPARGSSVIRATCFVLSIGSTTTAGLSQTAQSVSLQGAGSTFAAPLYKRWIEEYAASRPNVSRFVSCCERRVRLTTILVSMTGP